VVGHSLPFDGLLTANYREVIT